VLFRFLLLTRKLHFFL